MFGLLTPIWLAGMGSLAVPIALHLWSRRGGRPIRVGSIRLLAGSPPATRRQWTIQDPWLLALRCSVLVALALALAGPYWIPAASTTRTWALVSSRVADRDSLVDSLRRSGLEVSLLDSGPATPNLWAALRRADRAAPAGTQLVVFAPDQLRLFRGERPTLQAPVDWHARPAAVAAAVVPRTPNARLVAILPDPSRADDARYVTAALGAVGQASGIPAIISLREPTAAETVPPVDWIFWLSDRPIPEPIRLQIRRGAVLVSDVGGATAQRHRTRVVTGLEPTDAWLARGAMDPDPGAPVWADGTGSPLLSVTREGRGLHYRFHSRFFPGWGDFVLRPAFPLAMARLWGGAAIDSTAAAGDDRRITVSQQLPAQDSGRARTPERGARRSLFLPVWMLAVVLFLFERWLAARPPPAIT